MTRAVWNVRQQQRTKKFRHFIGDGPSRSDDNVVALFITSFHIEQLCTPQKTRTDDNNFIWSSLITSDGTETVQVTPLRRTLVSSPLQNSCHVIEKLNCCKRSRVFTVINNHTLQKTLWETKKPKMAKSRV